MKYFFFFFLTKIYLSFKFHEKLHIINDKNFNLKTIYGFSSKSWIVISYSAKLYPLKKMNYIIKQWNEICDNFSDKVILEN